MKLAKKPRIGLGLIILSIFTLISCQQESNSDQKADTVKNNSATPMAAPPIVDAAMAKKGEQLYNQNCVFCHQADAIGSPGIAPSLTNPELLAIAPKEFFVATIKNGRPGTGMPPFSHLGDNDINAIIAYLEDHATLPSRVAEISAQPEARGDPRLGKLWFDQVCSTCHGINGDGYSAGGTGTAIGTTGLLDVASDGFIRTTIKEGRSNTRMLPFQGPEALADLSDQEIDDIITYLHTLPSNGK